jgi:hypothetical protein
MGDDDESDWLIRTELAPRPAKPIEPVVPEPPPPPRTTAEERAQAVEVVLRYETPIATFWLAATDEEAAAVFVRRRVTFRNPFTGEMYAFEDVAVEADALAALPHLRDVALGSLSTTAESSQLLERLGCDARTIVYENATHELVAYALPGATTAKLASEDGTLAPLAKAAVDRGGKLWALLDWSVE